MYAGPGAGKSTQAALLFAKFKILGYNVELVTEYPKDKVWEESFRVMENQIYLFGKQQHRMWRIHDKVDIIVTDSPLLQHLAYSHNMTDTFRKLIVEQSENFLNFNVFLRRNEERFQQQGRNHNLEQSKELDQTIIDMVTLYQPLHYVDVNESTASEIVALMERENVLSKITLV